MLFIHETFLVYKLETFKRCRGLKHIMITIIAIIAHYDIQLLSVPPPPSSEREEQTRVHRSVLCKITIDLLYFWDIYDVNLLEQSIGRSTAYSCRANFIVLRKKRDYNAGVFLCNSWNCQEQWWLLLKTCNIT